MQHLELAVDHIGSTSNLTFRKLTLSTGEVGYLPQDVQIRVPHHHDVNPERLHLLAYIPWDDKYLAHIPAEYHDFFKFVLPHLHPRTTDVHTAVSVSFLPELIKAIGKPVDERLLYIALIVHDCGWSKVSHHEIADSLDYSGIAYTPSAAEAKTKHTIYGGAHAFQLLSDYHFSPPLTLEEKQLISDIVRFHERPHHYGAKPEQPTELVIACEADRLWPSTHENFWLDTIRKGVDASEYIENVANAVNEMLMTGEGRVIARRLLAERQKEVRALEQLLGR